MSPGILAPQPTAAAIEPLLFKGPKEGFTDGPQKFNTLAEEQGTGKEPPASHPNYLPIWDAEKKWEDALQFLQKPTDRGYRYPPLEPFQHYEHGKNADTTFKDLLSGSSSVTKITPSFGTEIRGVQLSSLNTQGKDQLALFAAERKVVGKSN